jgi:hypothetical protein
MTSSIATGPPVREWEHVNARPEDRFMHRIKLLLTLDNRAA